jgi:acylpyruvate hydrolase
MTSVSQEGDLILTGTPSGVGSFHAGDNIECILTDSSTGKELSRLQVMAVDREGGYQFVDSM